MDPNVRTESIVIEAVDVYGLSSPQRSFNYLLNFIPPRILSINGLGKICLNDVSQSSTIEFLLNFNRPIVRPSNISKPRIKFVNHADNSIVHSIITSDFIGLDTPTQTVRLTVSKSYFQALNTYSILFDFGAFVVNEYCKPQTDLVKDLNLFKFDFIDDSVKIQFVTKRNQVLGGSHASVQWTIEDGQVESCFLKADSENAYTQFNCSGRNDFQMAQFDSSFYSFYISYITPCLKLVKFSEILYFR